MAAPIPMWGDPHISPQFTRPTKVIHLRNLPFEVTADEIRQFCAPWGQIVAVKDKVGANRNQAFVEYAAIESAVAIVSHYQSSPEPAKFRGRPSWLSFSGRDKLTNIQATSDAATCVLQVALASVPADLTQLLSNVDVLAAAFGPFGFVRKAVLYSKPDGGLLAWLQFPDANAAAQAKAALGGQPFPRHLVNQHASPPKLEIAFSTHLDLPVRTQSYCTRDYTSAAIPWGEPDWPSITSLLPVGPEGSSNVLSVTFDQVTYPVTVDGLHTIFSTYGTVEKIHIFERDGRTQALVQYPDVRTADTAKAALEGHAMYDGGHNVMHVTYSKHQNLNIRPGSERSRDYTAAAQQQQQQQQQVPGMAPTAPAGVPAGVPGMQQAMPGMQQPMPGMPGTVPAKPPPPPPGPGMPPPRPQYQPPPAAAPPPATYGAPPPQAYDPNFHVTGEDFVRQHEAVLQQYGGRTSGRGAPAPYAAAPYATYASVAPVPTPPAPAAPAYQAQPAAPAAYPGYAAAAPATGYSPAAAATPAAGYATAPAAAGYAAAPAAAYGAAGAAPAYGAAAAAPAYGAAAAAPAYGAAPAYSAAPVAAAGYASAPPAAAGGYAAAPAAGGYYQQQPAPAATPSYGAAAPAAYGAVQPPAAGGYTGYGY